MAKEIQVNIELKTQDKTVALRIPNMVRKPHLKRVIAEALQMLKIKTPNRFDLLLNGKPIEICDTTIIDEYAFGNGDQLDIIEFLENSEKLEEGGLE